MENQPLRFRTTAFGGFQKQDVLNYLEKVTRDHAEKVAGLQKQLNDAREEQKTGEEKLAAYEAQVVRLEEENSRLTGEMSAREESLAQAARRCEDLETQLAALQARIDKLLPAAEAYEELKNRAAGIELDAHARAQAIEEASRQKAQKTKGEMLAWFDQLQSAYAGLHANLNAILSRAAGELRRAGEQVTGLAAGFQSQEDALKAMRAQVEALGPQAPKPFVEVESPAAPTPFTSGDN